ncbi:ABC transporter substrate-binding protein [uncultured Boseongicola sp.]|jgi:branched-chain amino acid transport system substrate-binding protein|uniref:ABC transporter substrate-binding protein n=1 Tax=uncultured Boseongicola sp. TaxID=1648499 RepID=UPI002631E862|nr:ABC transporter substrate-binding protein [uncultured Boseongicola sp.]
MRLKTLLAATALCALATAGTAQDALKIGMITTLSGPAGYLGTDVRDGFLLAIEEEGGTLGGVPVEVIVEDDGLKPENGRAIAERFLERDEVEIMTGVIFSNIAPVVAPLTLRAGRFYISPNSGPSQFAGKACHENYFVASWQNDTLHESAGIAASNLGYNNAYILAPNYQAGKDALAGFKRFFTGEIVEETYTQLGQTDYAAEIAKIRAAKPEMVFQFLPGGMGINFMKQYDQAGLRDEIPLVLAAPSADINILRAVGASMLGVQNTSHWNHDLDNAANIAFVASFEATYDRSPTVYASQGYDTARLIASALRATGGKVTADMDGFRAALQAADFEAVRGPFKFNTNNHPIQNWYGREVVEIDGEFRNRTTGIIAENHSDAYASECPM